MSLTLNARKYIEHDRERSALRLKTRMDRELPIRPSMTTNVPAYFKNEETFNVHCIV